jgi:hypothetical protein
VALERSYKDAVLEGRLEKQKETAGGLLDKTSCT